MSKRLGTRLRTLKKKKTEPSKTKTGKTVLRSTLGGASKLTDKVIDKMSSYYGMTIRRYLNDNRENPSVSELRDNIFSTVFHLTSTDKTPKHSRCPEGKDSWCFYKKALAEKRPPPSHKDMKIKLDLSENELKLVLGVYLDLTEPTLLSRCLRGRTQNKNESFHSKVWKKCLKTKFHGAQVTRFAFHMSVLEHNQGYVTSSLHHEILGGVAEAGIETKLEKKRLQKSMKTSLPRRKRSRTSQDEKLEGYGGGKF